MLGDYMNSIPSRKEFRAVTAAAVTCRACFVDITFKNKKSELELIKPSLIDIAQPRWVGPRYWASAPRVAIVMLNPGSGAGRSDAKNEESPDKRSLSLIQSFASGAGPLSAVFDHQAKDMPNWGGGRFVSFYLTGLNLELNNVAFANVAWCATSNNCYPTAMLKRCFDTHTGTLLHALAPNIILLSGSGTHRFASHVGDLIPEASVIRMFHYAHRESADAESAELERVKKLIAEARIVVTQPTLPADVAASRPRG